jgi:A/G-specific adenine glycosylase
MRLSFDPDEASRLLLDWYGREGRDLPWRHSRDPYRVWLSEIMLQQTTVAAVVPYFKRFLERFPTLEALASASLDEVISLWAGLGYYSRARNLHRTAQQLVAEQDGLFPKHLDALTALPGIGRSTAGAILSIAFDQPAPILDGNVRRVLVRLFAWLEDPRSGRAEKQLWSWAELLTPAESSHDYAQAIMDLGATVCTPRDPNCQCCPLRGLCQAHKQGLTATLPVARKKQKIPVRYQVALIIYSSERILLRQRPAEGFLGALWEFPTADLAAGQKPERASASLLSDLDLRGTIVESGEVQHAYSHFKLKLTVFRVEAEVATRVSDSGEYRWSSESEFKKLPLHGAHKKAYGKALSPFKVARKSICR